MTERKKTLEMVQSTEKNWIEIGKDNDIIFKYIRNARQMQLFDTVATIFGNKKHI